MNYFISTWELAAVNEVDVWFSQIAIFADYIANKFITQSDVTVCRLGCTISRCQSSLGEGREQWLIKWLQNTSVFESLGYICKQVRLTSFSWRVSEMQDRWSPQILQVPSTPSPNSTASKCAVIAEYFVNTKRTWTKTHNWVPLLGDIDNLNDDVYDREIFDCVQWRTPIPVSEHKCLCFRAETGFRVRSIDTIITFSYNTVRHQVSSLLDRRMSLDALFAVISFVVEF